MSRCTSIRHDAHGTMLARSYGVCMTSMMALWVADRKGYGAHQLWKAARRAGDDRASFGARSLWER